MKNKINKQINNILDGIFPKNLFVNYSEIKTAVAIPVNGRCSQRTFWQKKKPQNPCKILETCMLTPEKCDVRQCVSAWYFATVEFKPFV